MTTLVELSGNEGKVESSNNQKSKSNQQNMLPYDAKCHCSCSHRTEGINQAQT